jgi:lipoprotein-releasing system ATP-binding protein
MFLTADGIVKSYTVGGRVLTVLRDLDLTVERGEMLAIVGASGVGKSTLLHVLGGLDRPDAGTISVDGTTLTSLPDAEVVAFRNRQVGFVFQFHHLLPEFSALENVMLPAMIAGSSRSAARARARELLTALGVERRESHRPARLSGGEQQRVAIARAMANRPAVLLADEPTGNLDEATASAVFATLVQAARETTAALLIATHNAELAVRADATLRLHNGVIERP